MRYLMNPHSQSLQVELMQKVGFVKPLAVGQSRPALIQTFPASPKAVRQNILVEVRQVC